MPNDTSLNLAHMNSSAEFIQKHIKGDIELAIIAGSGLSNIMRGYLIKRSDHHIEIDTQDLDGFATQTTVSHSSKFIIANVYNKNIALFLGRCHLYEGYSAQQVCSPIYLLQMLGCQKLIISNAAGALNPEFTPGDVMLIKDHINHTGHNPLRGWSSTQQLPLDHPLYNAFVDMSCPYDRAMSKEATNAALQQGLKIKHGTYIGVMGPSLETSAERRMLRGFGADAVGMSTVMEVIAANHCQMKVLGLSAITNLALGNEQQKPDSIEDILRHADIAGQKMVKIMDAFLVQ